MIKVNETNLLKLGFVKTDKNIFNKNLIIYDPILEGEIDYVLHVYKDKRKWYITQNFKDLELLIDLSNLLNQYPELTYNDKLGFVYLLESKYGYKIGKSSQIHNRLKLFNVKLPFKWKMVKYILSENFHKLEKQLHAKFSNKLINGEWFQLDDNDIKKFNV